MYKFRRERAPRPSPIGTFSPLNSSLPHTTDTGMEEPMAARFVPEGFAEVMSIVAARGSRRAVPMSRSRWDLAI